MTILSKFECQRCSRLFSRQVHPWSDHIFITSENGRYSVTTAVYGPVCIHHIYTHTHTRLTALFPGPPRWAGTRKVKPIWILLKQETVSGSGISWAICKSAPRSRQITTPAPHHSVFYRPDALPAAQPTASKHWRHVYLPYDGVNNKTTEQFKVVHGTLIYPTLSYKKLLVSLNCPIKLWPTSWT